MKGLSDREIEAVRELVASKLGLVLDGSRLEELESALAERLEATGETGAAYLHRLSSPAAGAREMRALVPRLTVGESYFFRHAEHFTALFDDVLPRWFAGGRDRVRILSAGCSSGEEVHTLAFLALERVPDAAERVSILGIDVDPEAIARARAGVYSAWALRQTAEDVAARWFTRRGRTWEVVERARRLVSFEERNLVAEDASFWAPCAFDVVFCRNVIMYFSASAARAVVHRLAASLPGEGCLFLGHAETLRGLSHDFHLRHVEDAFYYEKKGGRAPAGAEEGRPAATPTVAPPSEEAWVDVILGASERIAALAASTSRPVPAAGLVPTLSGNADERPAEALELLSSLPSSAREDRDALLLRAVLLTNGGPTGEARQAIDRLLALDEFDPGAHYLMALCREAEGDDAAACEHHHRSIYLDPRFAMPHLHLGRLARKGGDTALAARTLSRAAELLAEEDSARILLFGGGFPREVLIAICRRESAAVGGAA